ncbi:hypothetical protein [Shewanella sp. WPAGA9]|uniref:hypothetical protein n=1 Tax=Shewanella sp. ENK2 TaxID=2775245 RepID=UPI00178021DA|nr:hypothetical protein [Shewanella sp. WPAGA9]
MDIDYTKYTKAELEDCLENIDREKYPERLQLIQEQLELSIENGDIKVIQKVRTKKEDKEFKWACSNLFLALIFALLAYTGLSKGSIGNAAKIGNYSLEESPFEFWFVVCLLFTFSIFKFYKSLKYFLKK